MTARFRGTTIIAVRHNGQVAVGGDGQVSLEQSIVKHTAKKVRRMHNDKVLAGFAGSVADAVTLFEKFESKLEEYRGNLNRAAVELAKEWRTDRMLRRLEALLVVADKEHMFLISGSGEVIEPDGAVLGIGSGGGYARAAAEALVKHSSLTAKEIAEESLRIAASMCVYSNDKICVETIN